MAPKKRAMDLKKPKSRKDAPPRKPKDRIGLLPNEQRDDLPTAPKVVRSAMDLLVEFLGKNRRPERR